MSDPVRAACATWDRYRWTNALLAIDRSARLAHAGPLAGRLFSAKDLYATAGLTTTAGSLVLERWRPDQDATAVARLRSAGATLFAKGNCAEFGIGTDTETRVGGRVLHPFDPGLSPGGSSGGDAVAVATGIVDFALAGDYGGSVRWPAQAVGVYGLRTSVGLVPRTGRVPGAGARYGHPAPGAPAAASLQGRLEVAGVFARDPNLIAAVVSALAGSDGIDWSGVRVPPRPHSRTGRLALSTGEEVAPIDDAVRAALARAADAARASGYEVVRADGILEGAYPLYTRLRARLDDHVDLRRLCAGREDLCCPATAALLAAPPPPVGPDAELSADLGAASRFADALTRLFDDVDALLAPVAPVGASAHGAGVVVGGRHLAGAELMAHCRAVSLSGLPALSMPVRDGGGPFVSLQIVGPPGGDWRCCEIADELADRLGAR